PCESYRSCPELASSPAVAAAPCRPIHYVERSSLTSRAVYSLLRASCQGQGSGSGSGSVLGSGAESGLVKGKGSSGLGAVVWLVGSAGAGKSVVAGEVVRRKEIRAVFPGCVLWLQVRVRARKKRLGSGLKLGLG
ncbi:unnamed protein product, partial [Discosporangium mesarthrocarpum]